MVDNAQMLKGILEGCVLEIVSREETYGYKLTADLNHAGFQNLNEGSVYPVLIRLEKKGLLISVTKESSLGPNRKYFSITSDGMTYLNGFKLLWENISNVVNTIIGEVKFDEILRKK